MTTNEHTFNKEKRFEEYEDSFWRLAMMGYAEQEGVNFIKEKEELIKNPSYQPSPNAIKNFKKMLGATFRKKNTKLIMKGAYKALNKVAVITFICTILFSATVVSVEAFRIQVLNFLISFEKEYTSIKLDSENMSNIIGDNLYMTWHDSYVPTYIPEGYRISGLNYASDYKIISYINSENKRITFAEFDASMESNVDTENASQIRSITINGNEGLLVVKDSQITIAWSASTRMLVLNTQLDVDSSIQIAESVIFNK